MSDRPKYLYNRRVIIERDFNRAGSQRFHFYWDNPYGTKSHEGYAATWVGALTKATFRKVRAEFSQWQRNRPTKTWRLP